MTALDPEFSMECFYNEYLPDDGSDVDAVVTVACSGPGPSVTDQSEASEVILLDVSGSMAGQKLAEARRATAAAIECLRDGVHFAVIRGNHEALQVYPERGLAVADRRTRQKAVDALKKLKAGGGTAMGEWIRAATSLLEGRSGVHHAILLTDGRNETERPSDLRDALEEAAGVFQCDCRGVGSDWEVAELRSVAAALLGSVDIVADPEHLSADFESMVRGAMGKTLADVAVRVWTPTGTDISFFKQVAPDLVDLTSARVEIDERSGEYPTGAWGNESRDYHLSLRVKPGRIGDQMRAARVAMVVDGQTRQETVVAVKWTEETYLSTRVNRRVAHYTGQQELADAIQEGLEARRNGDEDTARVRLGRAVQLAAAADDPDKLGLLSRVVEVEDATTGRVRLRAAVPVEDEMTLDTRSTRTARVHR
jgi:hypothetical protein